MKHILPVLFFLVFFLITSSNSFAVENPASVANNKFGIHILFVNELYQAAALVNSNGGKWGYVTIPIQAGDRDIEKWQSFMNDAKKIKAIPILRIATEGDYFNTKVWRKPTEEDILDFANFLSSLTWPTKNKYVIVFNETNRGDEWGGTPNPQEYAKLLSYAVSVFKSKDPDFFIISAGMDNAAATVYNSSINQYQYFEEMNNAVPGIFYQIDGFGSHSYPNPAFSKPPTIQDQNSIASFRFEKELIQQLGGKDLPVFITETGWRRDKVSDSVIESYYRYAFEQVWNDASVIAVTPFLLNAASGPFTDFSFIDIGGHPTINYQSLEKIAKIAGNPIQETAVLASTSASPSLQTKKFEHKELLPKKKNYASRFLYWLLKI